MITFFVEGRPFDKQRSRTSRWHLRPYTPSKTTSYEDLVLFRYKEKYGDKKLHGAIGQIVIAKFPIPESASKIERAKMLSGSIRPTIRPDYDNVAKVISDALQGIVFDDDKQIVENAEQKVYAEVPGVQVVLYEIGEGL